MLTLISPLRLVATAAVVVALAGGVALATGMAAARPGTPPVGMPAQPAPPVSEGPAPAPAPSADHVVEVNGSRLLDGTGAEVRLRGVNRSGTQYACVDGDGFFDGPVDDQAIRAISGWGANAVRVSLNEDCWLGINDVPKAFSGASYRAVIRAFVDRLLRHSLFVVLDLHWNAPGNQTARDQQAMPDRDHAPDFWRSVAEAFRDERGVLFDLYNEPYPDGNRNTEAAWRCVRDGGHCPGVPFVAAGSRELLGAVRSTGSRNVVLVGGPQYAGILDRWLEFAPEDPSGQVAASIHIYGPDWSPCWQRSCWDAQIAPLAAQVPVVIGEMGDKDCDTTLIDPLMDWADARSISYLAWSWTPGDCAGEPALITDYSGNPTKYGAGLRRHLLATERSAGRR